MATDFPQELLDAIVDEVAGLHFRDLRSLLKSSPRFGHQCRLHLYRQVTVAAHRRSPSAFLDLLMQCPNVGGCVDVFRVAFGKDAGPLFWSTVSEIMTRLPRLKAVTFTEGLTVRGSGIPPCKMMVEDLPRMDTVKSVQVKYVRSLSVENVARILSAFPNVSALEIFRCNVVGDQDSIMTSVAPPVPVVLETLSVLDAPSFVTEIAARSVAPPMISLRKLRRLVLADSARVDTRRMSPSYQDLYTQMRGIVMELIIYADFRGVLGKSTLFVEVPSLIIVLPSDLDFTLLSHMLQISCVERHARSRGLQNLALVLGWSMDSHPVWSNLADLLAKLTLPPFSVCITLAWPAALRRGDYRNLSDVQVEHEVMKYFKGTKQPVRVQVLDMDLRDWDFHMKSTEFLYH